MASTQPIDARGDKIYTVLHAVNLRTRTEPPMSERHFGNISRLAITVPTVDAGTDGGHKIVDQVMTLADWWGHRLSVPMEDWFTEGILGLVRPVYKIGLPIDVSNCWFLI